MARIPESGLWLAAFRSLWLSVSWLIPSRLRVTATRTLAIGFRLYSCFFDMEGDMTLKLEVAVTHLGERAALASEFPLFLENRRGDSE
jgi:hypothetical protein